MKFTLVLPLPFKLVLRFTLATRRGRFRRSRRAFDPRAHAPNVRFLFS